MIVPCKQCGQAVSTDQQFCPNCGSKVKKPVYAQWWFYVLIVLLALLFISSMKAEVETTIDYETEIEEVEETNLEETNQTDEPASAAPTTTTAEAASAQPKNVVDNCAIEVGEVVFDTDYEGSKVAVIPITWTNGTDDSAAFWLTLDATVYQNGIECDDAFVMRDGSPYADEGTDIEIKPGASFTIYKNVVLRDETTDLELAITPWLYYGTPETYTVFIPIGE